MGRTCTACTHEKRQEIDKALVTGATHREVSERFRLSPSAVYRHKQGHLPARLKRAFEATETRKAVELVQHQTEERAKEVGQAIDIVQQLRAINSATLQVLQAARESEKHSLSLQAVDRVHKQIELQAKLLGELQETGPQLSVFINPEWHEVRVNVLAALSPFPEARSAVSKVLSDVGP